MMINRKGILEFLQKIIPNIFWTVRNTTRNIYLTFDDGPHPEYTCQVLDVLKHYKVKATFFLIGEQAAEFPEYVKRIRDEGHTIGIHGFTHAHPKSLGIIGYLQDCEKAKDAIESAISMKLSNIFLRPPYGHISLIPTALLLLKRNKVAMWSIDSMDWNSKSPTEIVDKIFHIELRGGDIILFHDDCENTVTALSTIIERLTGHGYEFAKL